MSETVKNGMQCAEFERVLSDAFDEKLDPQSFEGLQAHARSCATCGPLFVEADAGRRWLKSLDEVQPPQYLVQNILVATSGFDTSRSAQTLGSQPTWGERFRDWAGSMLAPAFAVARQPRFAMSFGMAFFSLSVSLSLAGVKLSDVRHVDLRPSAIKRNYYATSGRVVKYYENVRFVYEIESRVREFKRATVPVAPPEDKNKNRKDNTSEQPDKRQDRNYSQEDNLQILAVIPTHPPVVSGSTDRRLS